MSCWEHPGLFLQFDCNINFFLFFYHYLCQTCSFFLFDFFVPAQTQHAPPPSEEAICCCFNIKKVFVYLSCCHSNMLAQHLCCRYRTTPNSIIIKAPKLAVPLEDLDLMVKFHTVPFSCYYTHTFPGQVSSLGKQRISQTCTSFGKCWPSAAVAKSGAKE